MLSLQLHKAIEPINVRHPDQEPDVFYLHISVIAVRPAVLKRGHSCVCFELPCKV